MNVCTTLEAFNGLALFAVQVLVALRHRAPHPPVVRPQPGGLRTGGRQEGRTDGRKEEKDGRKEGRKRRTEGRKEGREGRKEGRKRRKGRKKRKDGRTGMKE
jgi:hypothetical protein